LQAAVARNQDGLVRYLLDRNVDVQQEGGLYGFTIIAAAALSSLELVKLLLNVGADATVVDDTKWTALHHAAKRGAAEIVRCLLDHGAQVNSMTSERITAANLACRLGHKDVLSILIAEGADIALTDVDDVSPLQQALENGHQDLALELIDRLSFTTTTHLRWGPLQTAARAGYTSIIKKMIDKKVDVNMLDECDWTALQLAAALGDTEAVQTPIGAGADITLAHADTSPPLQIAAGNNHVAIIKLLAENGTDMNQLGDGGTTALIVAVSNSCQDALEALLDMGASMKCMYSHEQQSLFDIAIEEGQDIITKILIARGCVGPRGLTATAEQGVTTLSDMNQHQYLPILSYQDDTKGSADRLPIMTTPCPMCELNEALHVASARGSKSIVQILLARGASAKTQDINGRSALHYAVRHLKLDIADLLIEYGADPLAQDDIGSTPLDLAVCHGLRAAAFIRKHMDDLTLGIIRRPSLLEAINSNQTPRLSSQTIWNLISGPWTGNYKYLSWQEGEREAFSIEIPSVGMDESRPSTFLSEHEHDEIGDFQIP
jgi:ankyrin repeat protein